MGMPEQGPGPPQRPDLALDATIRSSGSPLREGQQLGRYRLVSELGRGGMGIVWRGTDAELGDRPVALKFLPWQVAGDKLAMSHLRREARAMLELSHPAIVRLHTLERHDDLLFLVMECLAGPTLRDLLAERVEAGGGLSVAEVEWLLERLAPALDYAHGKGVLHRDVKPANLMLTQRPAGPLHTANLEVKLCDFGIAWVTGATMTQLTGAGPGAGTLPYMAPEVLEGQDPLPASDIYALGATLFELVRGRPPFAHGDIAAQARSRPAPPLGSGHAGLDAAVASALAKDPGQRPPGGLALLAAVRGAGPPGASPVRMVRTTEEVPGGRLTGAVLPVGWEALDPGDVRLPRARDPATGVVFRLIPAGTFWMGSLEDELGFDDEGPRRQVTLSQAFWLAETEVTQAQWRKVMGSAPSYFKGDTLPVERVSWEDAQEFCKRAGYRLPTEAEWEYACRAETETAWSSGASERDLGKVAWDSDNSDESTHPVGTKAPNKWGLYDMHGNVEEWCADVYDEEAYSKLGATDPVMSSGAGPRVLRGGSWNFNATFCRSANRFRGDPGGRLGDIGFRPARTPP